MQIRRATKRDVRAIRALLESEVGHWRPEWSNATLTRALVAAGDLALVAVARGSILGFACAHDVGFRGYLSDLVVAPGARRRGIGAALLARIERVLARRGRRVVIVDAWPPAATYYRKLGWQPPDAVLLARRLGPAR
jgi:predicted N-acetyltransferase YhbS